jgi:hypothetical protein
MEFRELILLRFILFNKDFKSFLLKLFVYSVDEFMSF